MNKQLALAIQLNDEATLADFCWGDNVLLKTQIEQLTAGNKETLLYIWGNTGCGKSHLLQGCCQSIAETSQAIYLPLKIVFEMGPDILEGIETQTLICIDDIDVIAGDSVWEEAFFHFYNRIRDANQTTLIISSPKKPTALEIKLPDLKSRLSWGLVFQLNELNEKNKVETLRNLAKKRGFDLSEPVIQYLLNRCARNMHDLKQLLDKLDEASLIMQRKVTIPFVKQVLEL